MSGTAATSGAARWGAMLAAAARALALPAVLLATWIVVSESFLDSKVLPGPIKVISAGREFFFAPPLESSYGLVPFEGTGWRHIRASVIRLLGAFGLATLVGVPLGLALGLSRRFAAYVEPLVASMRPIPIFAWAPLAIAWFGIEEGSTRFLIFFGALFPIAVSTADGVIRVPRDYVERARVLGTRGVVFKVHVRAAMPSILTGLRLGITLGWMSVVIGELTGQRLGVGAMMNSSRESGQLERVMVGIACFGVLGAVSDYALRVLFAPFVRWSRT